MLAASSAHDLPEQIDASASICRGGDANEGVASMNTQPNFGLMLLNALNLLSLSAGTADVAGPATGSTRSRMARNGLYGSQFASDNGSAVVHGRPIVQLNSSFVAI
jgi:hypothetical protein